MKKQAKPIKEESKTHAKAELKALAKGGASKAMLKSERAEYGLKNGGMVKGKKC